MLPAKRSAKFITSRCNTRGSALRHCDDAAKAFDFPDGSFDPCFDDPPPAAQPATVRPIHTARKGGGRRFMAFAGAVRRALYCGVIGERNIAAADGACGRAMTCAL